MHSLKSKKEEEEEETRGDPRNSLSLREEKTAVLCRLLERRDDEGDGGRLVGAPPRLLPYLQLHFSSRGKHRIAVTHASPSLLLSNTHTHLGLTAEDSSGRVHSDSDSQTQKRRGEKREEGGGSRRECDQIAD